MTPGPGTGAVGKDLARPCIVVSQPMYFPWVGLLEQIRLADVFVHYSDVQFSRGFLNRVQAKTETGMRWLTVPLSDLHRGQRIDEVRVDESRDWRRAHRDVLAQAYRGAPHCREMLALVDEVHGEEHATLAGLAKASTMALAHYFGLATGRRFLESAELDCPGASTERLVDICARLGARTYLTGHGARAYLDHERFERRGIQVAYVDYGLTPYPQQHGEFTPYVSALDLVAQRGREGVDCIRGRPVPWREFLSRTSAPVTHA